MLRDGSYRFTGDPAGVGEVSIPQENAGGQGRRAFLLKSEEGDCKGGGGKAELAEGLLGHF